MVRIYKNSILFQIYGVYHAKNVDGKDFQRAISLLILQ